MNLDEYEEAYDSKYEFYFLEENWNVPLADRPHYVYRFWNDEAPEGHSLLYIGFTGCFGSRDSIHWSQSMWRKSVTRIDIQEYPTKAAARAAESAAITSEVPVHNLLHNPRRLEVHGQYSNDQIAYGRAVRTILLGH